MLCQPHNTKILRVKVTPKSSRILFKNLRKVALIKKLAFTQLISPKLKLLNPLRIDKKDHTVHGLVRRRKLLRKSLNVR